MLLKPGERSSRHGRAHKASFAFALLILGFAGVSSLGCDRGHGTPPLRVFAAASLSESLLEVAESFEAAGGGSIELNLAGSNVLARQVEAGAPADFLIFADRRQMQRVVSAGKVSAETVFELLANRLVVVVPRDSEVRRLESPDELLRFERLALADPLAVPAGVYARQWLETVGLWSRLEPRVVPSGDVRAALAAVAGGHIAAGVVYATDAATEPRVRVVFTPEPGPRVRYLAAPVVGAHRVANWSRYLRSPEAGQIFHRHGFEVLTPVA